MINRRYYNLFIKASDTGTKMNTWFTRITKKHNITILEFKILDSLRSSLTNGMNTKRLVNSVNRERPFVVISFNRLHKKGYVDKIKGKNRSSPVVGIINESGMELYEKVSKDIDRILEELKILTVGEMQQLDRLLDKIEEI